MKVETAELDDEGNRVYIFEYGPMAITFNRLQMDDITVEFCGPENPRGSILTDRLPEELFEEVKRLAQLDVMEPEIDPGR